MTNVQPVAIDGGRPRARTLAVPHEYQTICGCGSGRICARCGAVIPTNRMEIEVQYAPESGLDSLVLHVKCFPAWIGTASGVEY